MNIQVIERNGKPEWAILPYEEYLHLLEQAEMLQDIRDYDQAKTALENGEDEAIPASWAEKLIDGESPMKTWREYRQKTQHQVAEAAGISVPYLSQIETGKRKPSTRVMRQLAMTLQVSVDDLMGIE